MSDIQVTGAMHPFEGLPGSQSISSEALKLPAETLSPTDSERQICRPDCGDTCTLVDLTEETRSGIHYSKTALEMIRSIGSFSLDDPTRHTLRSATTVKGGSNEASSSCAKAFMLWSDWFKSADMLRDQNAGAQSAHEYDRDYAVYGPDKVFYRKSEIGLDVEMYLNGIPQRVHTASQHITTRWLVRVQYRAAPDVTWRVGVFTTEWRRSGDNWQERNRGSVYQYQGNSPDGCKTKLSRYVEGQKPWSTPRNT
jgi:hypothetical protein